MLGLVFVLSSTMFMGAGFAAGQEEIEQETRYLSYQPITPFGGNLIGGVSERIDYHRRESITNRTNPPAPSYATNYTCGVTAGSVIIAYHNRTMPNLIPGHNAGIMLPNGAFLWAPGSSPGLLNTYTAIFNAMGGCMGGVTMLQWMGGMSSFIGQRGHSVIFGAAHTGPNSLNQTYFRNQIANGRPVALFLNGFNIMGGGGLQVFSEQGFDLVTFGAYAGAHIMVAYGYNIVSYFDANDVMFRQDVYLNVNTGLGPNAFIRINTHAHMDWAMSLVIS